MYLRNRADFCEKQFGRPSFRVEFAGRFILLFFFREIWLALQRPKFCRKPCRGESNRHLTLILLKSIAIHLPFSIAILLQKYALLLAESSKKTPPICITIRLPFVSRCFCRSVRVRGRWGTPNERCLPNLWFRILIFKSPRNANPYPQPRFLPR